MKRISFKLTQSLALCRYLVCMATSLAGQTGFPKLVEVIPYLSHMPEGGCVFKWNVVAINPVWKSTCRCCSGVNPHYWSAVLNNVYAKAVEEPHTGLALPLFQDQVSSLCEWPPGTAASRRLRLHLRPLPVEPLCWQAGAAGLRAEGCLGRCCHLHFSPSLPRGAARDSLTGYCPLWGQGRAAVAAHPTSVPFKERGGRYQYAGLLCGCGIAEPVVSERLEGPWCCSVCCNRTESVAFSLLLYLLCAWKAALLQLRITGTCVLDQIQHWFLCCWCLCLLLSQVLSSGLS